MIAQVSQNITSEQALLLLILLIGILLVLALLTKAGLERLGLPPLVGYIALGMALHYADQQFSLLTSGEREVLTFLADIGIISLLFRVGLESKLEELLRQLRRASIVWLSNILVSGGLGVLTAFGLLRLGLIPSLFIGTAMTATSVGISVSLWRDAGAIHSRNGELMLDVAEMDDISAVVLMGLLFAVAPMLQANPAGAIAPLLAQTSGIFALKAIVFGAICYLFSRYAEQPITRFFETIGSPPDPIIMVAGLGLITAAFAGLLGFSVAIGAFFAGLVFSRDPDAVKLDASFDTFYEAFVPFFFIGIGLQIELGLVPTALALGLPLLGVAVVGKLIGVAVPVWQMENWQGATLLGISMVPRAEITMIVMQHGLQLGDWAVPPQVFSAMIVVAAATTILVPLALRPLLQRWPQTQSS